MNKKKYRWILYLIIVATTVTIGIQVYWNYQHYLEQKKVFVSDVQQCLDNAVDEYYTVAVKKQSYGIYKMEDKDEEKDKLNLIKDLENSDSPELKELVENLKKEVDSIEKANIQYFRGKEADSVKKQLKKNYEDYDTTTITDEEVKERLKAGDSTITYKPADMTKLNYMVKVFSSMDVDTLDLSVLDTLFQKELAKKQLDIKPTLSFYNPYLKLKKSKHPQADSLTKTLQNKNLLHTSSTASLLPQNSILTASFENSPYLIVKRILVGLVISIFLVSAVVASLFYLLHIINQQKQLSEIKNDLISNITHEFKTPIATIAVALEGISNFNVIDDKEKTKKYLYKSSEQLSKLTAMVEKILETATLDSRDLQLNKETVNIVDLLTIMVNQYQVQHSKAFHFNPKIDTCMLHIDVFHFENAVNNILDNAVKYGGDTISINLINKAKSVEISVSDNGNTLTKAQAERIFEKFYRVPKGNIQTVKGFGIGLYYTKTIIEKHAGQIAVSLKNNLTTFKIRLTHD